MEIIRLAALMVLVFPVPFILGFIPVKYMDGLQRTPAMTYVCGWFVSFFVFELVSVPLIMLELRFTVLVAIYTSAIAVLVLLSLRHGRGVWRDCAANMRATAGLSTAVKLGWAIFLMIVACQVVYSIFYEYYDGDDAYYIAVSVLTKKFDTMYLRDAYSGYIMPLDARHAFSPTPIYQAWLSQLSGVAPAVVAHSVLAPVWLVFMYCIYAQIGRQLLRDKDVYRPVFMILISVWLMFGNISLYTAETFAMTRTWQGKGIMAGMVIPAMFFCFLCFVREEVSQGVWLLFICVCMSGVFATSVSFMIVPTATAVAATLIGIKKRSPRFAFELFSCCAPCLMLALCYVAVK